MTKEDLNSVRELQKKIRNLERHVQELRMSIENLTSVLDGLPHSNQVRSRVESLALKIVDEERDLEGLRGELEGTKARLANLILDEVSEPVLQVLLLLRYFECLPFKNVARRMRISLRHVFRLHENFFRCHIAAQKEV